MENRIKSALAAFVILVGLLTGHAQGVTLRYMNGVEDISSSEQYTQTSQEKGKEVKKKDKDKGKLFKEIVESSRQPGKVVWDFTNYPSDTFKRELFLSGINLVYIDKVPDKVTIQYEGVSVVKGLKIAFPDCDVKQRDSNTYMVTCLITKLFHLPFTYTQSKLSISSSDSSTGGGSSSAGASSGNSSSGSGDYKMEREFSYYDLLKKQIKQMLSKDGRYSISYASGFVSITDHRQNVERVAHFLNQEMFLTKNIKFRVKLLRVELSSGYEYGIDWNRIISGGILKNFNISVSGTTSVEKPVFSISAGQENMTAVIKALKKYGKVEKVQEWEEISKGGETAVMRQVKVYPYVASVSTSQSATSTLTTPEFQEIELGLKITINHILGDNNMITMNGVVDTSTLIEFKQFQVSGTNVERPVYTRDFIRFQASVPVGQTIIISGLKLKSKEGKNETAPLVSGVPILDWLFGHKTRNQNNVEYLVVVTPEYTPF